MCMILICKVLKNVLFEQPLVCCVLDSTWLQELALLSPIKTKVTQSATSGFSDLQVLYVMAVAFRAKIVQNDPYFQYKLALVIVRL
jgi:hypothetical protein